jgi:malonate decarboxylase beta subunit
VVHDFFQRGLPACHRSDQVAGFLARLAEVDASVQATPERIRAIYQKGFSA